MIQLYKKGNRDYDRNGDYTLAPISCYLERELNGSWELTLETPLDELGAYKDLTVEAIIKASVPEGDKLFSVYDTDKISENSVVAYARPVFLCAANDAFLLDVRPTSKNGQEALDILTEGTAYAGSSNISTVNTAYYVRKNLIEAISSDDENSFLNRWGGEILYDDFKVIINDRVGGDYGVKIMYGRNLESVEEHVNIEEMATRILPIAYNGYTLEGDAPWVDSPLIGLFERVYTKVIRYEDVKLTEDCAEDEAGFDTLAELRAELIRRCKMEYDNGIDKPTVTLNVNMIDLAKTTEYRDYKVLEEVNLGDDVGCVHERMGINTTARVIGQKWDCIQKRNVQLTIGSFEANYFDKLTSAANTVNKVIDQKSQTVMAERISGILNGIRTQLKYQKNVAQKQDVRAILFEDIDPESETYGALAIGTQGFQIANKRTTDGRDWEWTTAFTAQGGYANTIILGTLSDKMGKNFWNLDSGEFALSAATTVGGKKIGTIASEAGKDAAGEVVKAQTQEDIFNKLTNNGALKGIYMKDGILYINFDYAFGGTLKLGGCDNERGTIEILDANDEVVGSIDNGSFSARTLSIGDRIIVYNSDKTSECSIGFDPETNTLYINGTNINVNIPALISAAATIAELNATNITASEKMIANVLKALTSVYSPYYSGKNMYLEEELTADGDVIGDGVSLKNHNHKMLVGSNHSLVMNYSGGSYVVPKKADGETADSGAVTLGGNNNKFKAIYAVNGTIQTSDEREKNIVGGIDERHRKLLRSLKPILYSWKNGDSGLHAGLGAQTTERAMRECGIGPEEQFCVRYEDGSYSMIYDELIPLIIDSLQNIIDRIERLER